MHRTFKYSGIELIITDEYSQKYCKYFEDIGYDLNLIDIENDNKHIIFCLYDNKLLYFNILNEIFNDVAELKTVVGYNYSYNCINYNVAEIILKSLKIVWPKILYFKDITKLHPFDNYGPLCDKSYKQPIKTVYYNDLKNYEANNLIGKTRNIIKKAQKVINVKSSANKNEFVNNYNEFLMRKGFDKKYFIEKNIESIKNLDVFIGFDNQYNNILGGICCYKRKSIVDYHYSFNTLQGNKFACNSLILHEISKFYMNANYEKFYLGGGVSNSDKDPLALFKKRNSIKNIQYNISITNYGL